MLACCWLVACYSCCLDELIWKSLQPLQTLQVKLLSSLWHTPSSVNQSIGNSWHQIKLSSPTQIQTQVLQFQKSEWNWAFRANANTLKLGLNPGQAYQGKKATRLYGHDPLRFRTKSVKLHVQTKKMTVVISGHVAGDPLKMCMQMRSGAKVVQSTLLKLGFFCVLYGCQLSHVLS